MTSIQSDSNDLNGASKRSTIISPGKSLEDRINEARKRAENFSISLSEARKKESSHLKAIDEDKMKWANAYAAKVVELEQVERELAHAIVAIKAQEMESSNTTVSSPADTSTQQDSHHNLNESYHQSLQENNKLQVELAAAKSQLEVASKQLEVYQYKIENLNSTNANLASTLKETESKLDLRQSQVGGNLEKTYITSK
jgi:chromosome segregation ATPase